MDDKSKAETGVVGPSRTETGAKPACCTPSELGSCCQPSAKAACCGQQPAPPSSCGCR